MPRDCWVLVAAPAVLCVPRGATPWCWYLVGWVLHQMWWDVAGLGMDGDGGFGASIWQWSHLISKVFANQNDSLWVSWGWPAAARGLGWARTTLYPLPGFWAAQTSGSIFSFSEQISFLFPALKNRVSPEVSIYCWKQAETRNSQDQLPGGSAGSRRLPGVPFLPLAKVLGLGARCVAH